MTLPINRVKKRVSIVRFAGNPHVFNQEKVEISTYNDNKCDEEDRSPGIHQLLVLAQIQWSAQLSN